MWTSQCTNLNIPSYPRLFGPHPDAFPHRRMLSTPAGHRIPAPFAAGHFRRPNANVLLPAAGKDAIKKPLPQCEKGFFVLAGDYINECLS